MYIHGLLNQLIIFTQEYIKTKKGQVIGWHFWYVTQDYAFVKRHQRDPGGRGPEASQWTGDKRAMQGVY